MFRKSNTHTQLNLFTSVNTVLLNSVIKDLNDPTKWYNQFRENITMRINEELFRPLFCEDNGAPNSSIRILCAMNILKDGKNWSDLVLFEECKLNLGVRVSLGLFNLDEAVPSNATYYNFRARVAQYEEETGINLINLVFSQITQEQILEFGLCGDRIRLDSTYIGSDIAWKNRYNLIHDTLCLAYLKIKPWVDNFLTKEVKEQLQEITKEEGEKVTFRTPRESIKAKTQNLGLLIYSIISLIKNDSTKHMATLRTLFYQHFEIVDDNVCLLSKKQLKATNIQSPHDTECDYREKGDTAVKGYSANITETCNPENPFNLVTDAMLEPASKSDVDYTIPAIKNSQSILPDKIESVHADGAYHNMENQNYCKDNGIDLVVSDLTGKRPSLSFHFDENKQLIVTCLRTNTIIPAKEIQRKDPNLPPMWKVIIEGKERKITLEEVIRSILRQEIANRSITELNIRNNVESAINHLTCHCPDNKTKYRGLIKHRIWVNIRCLWINFIRIWKYLKSLKPKDAPVYPINANRHDINLQNINIFFFFLAFWVNIKKMAFQNIFLGDFCTKLTNIQNFVISQ